MRTPLALVLLATLAAPALAQQAPAATPIVAVAQAARPRSVNDCEQVKGDLAYNQCLSMFGPAAHTKGAAVGSGDGAEAAAAVVPAAEPAVQSRRGRRGRTVRRGGRQSASFAVGGHGRHAGGRRRHR
jgi:hypothetical protein